MEKRFIISVLHTIFLITVNFSESDNNSIYIIYMIIYCELSIEMFPSQNHRSNYWIELFYFLKIIRCVPRSKSHLRFRGPKFMTTITIIASQIVVS